MNYSVVTCSLNDQNLTTIAWLVSRYHPFSTYSFGLMLDRLYEQLDRKNNIALSENGKIVAYAGWIYVNEKEARIWQHTNDSSVPAARLSGDAVVVTIVVVQNKNFLLPLIRAISHQCAGKPVYRKRSFADGRPEMIRPPIRGRSHKVVSFK